MKKFLIIMLTTFIFGCASKQTISGIIYISGNEPFTHLSIKTDDDMYYKIECSDLLKKELWQLQGSKVELFYNELKDLTAQKVIVISNYKKLEQNIEEGMDD